jgi:endonuclease III
MANTNWAVALQPLIKKYKNKPHPLEFRNLYQLVVMVILSAQDSDKHINAVAPPFFRIYPNLKSLSSATDESLLPLLGKVRGHRNKIKWILAIAKELKDNKNIPLTMEGLTALPGIGRKSANVIMRSAGAEAEGVMVDLHVARVAPRIGVARSADPKKIEQELMQAMPRKDWGEIGMAISFLGRETCRPSHPQHEECIVSKHCAYFKATRGKVKLKAPLKENKKTGVKKAMPRKPASVKNKKTRIIK